jgi:hypothetical protein
MIMYPQLIKCKGNVLKKTFFLFSLNKILTKKMEDCISKQIYQLK